MVTTAGVTYTYDGDGRLVKKAANPPSQQVDKLYWYGVQGEVLAESDLSGTILYEYIYFNGKRIARRTPSGTIHYYLADRLGSARVMVNSTGGVVEESDFLPYGTERVIADTLDNTYKFTGFERDTESGLDHTLHRQYASNLGRWHSPDPARGKVANPQSWNRYSYGSNSPCNAIDRNGGTPESPEVYPGYTGPGLPPGWIPVYGSTSPYVEEPTNSITTADLALDWSRTRVYKLLENDDCAKAIGAEGWAHAASRLNGTKLLYSDLGQLKVSKNPDGTAGDPLKGSGNVAGYPSNGGRMLLNNNGVNWFDPNNSDGIDENGYSIKIDLLSRVMRDVGAKEMSIEQFMDFHVLHELSHSFRVPDGEGIDRGIWERCFGK